MDAADDSRQFALINSQKQGHITTIKQFQVEIAGQGSLLAAQATQNTQLITEKSAVEQSLQAQATQDECSMP